MTRKSKKLTSLELCAGGGGQALGLEAAGFEHIALVENDEHPCATLRLNRPHWNVVEKCLREFDAKDYRGVDLVAGGVPCQPFSSGGKQLGEFDPRDLFPEAIRIISECSPKIVLLENVRGLADSKFADYRSWILKELFDLGYSCEWKVVDARDFGVPQARLRFILVGRHDGFAPFPWPKPVAKTPTVSDAIGDLMNSNKWKGYRAWKKKADQHAPCIVGGSKKHGGPDLGPQRAKRAWLELGVNGKGIADTPPEKDFTGEPKITNRMAARLQGFPDDWEFAGRKTATYRQIGNAFPPNVAEGLGRSLVKWLHTAPTSEKQLFEATQLELQIAS